MKKYAVVGTLLTVFALSLRGGGALLAQANQTTVAVTASESLVARYTFSDEANLGKDSSGKSHDLIVNNAAQVAQGKYGVNLAGTEANGGNMGMLYAPYAEGTTTDFSDSVSGEYTVTFWGVMTGTGYVVQSGQWESAFSVAHNGADSFVACGAGETKTNFPTTANVWHYVTVSASTTEGKAYYYLDGVLKSTQNMVGTQFSMAAANAAFTIGGQCNPKDNWFANGMKGSFADFRIYSKALSATEVTSAMAEAGITAGTDGANEKEEAPIQPELIAHYDFAEEKNLGKDISGNSHHLLVNGSGVTKGKKGVSLSGDGVSMLYAPYADGTTKDFSDDISGDYTVSFWTESDATGNEYLIQTGQFESGFSVATNSADFFMKAGAGQTAANWGVTKNVWNHIAVVASTTDKKAYYYFNGELKATLDMVSEQFTMASAFTFSIGGSANPTPAGANYAYSYAGSFADFRIYDGALNAASVKETMALSGIEVGSSGDNIDWIEPETEGKLIARYEFKDANNVGKDSTGNHDLSYTKAETPVAVADGGATFAGKSALYDTDDFADLIQDYTVSLWVKCDNSDNVGFILTTGCFENSFHISAAFHKIWISYGPPSGDTVGLDCVMTNDTWTNIIVTASSALGEVRVYINGEPILRQRNVAAEKIGMAEDTFALTVGGQADEKGDSVDGLFTGSVKDIRIYNGMLNKTSVAALYSGENVNPGTGNSIKATDINNVVSEANTVAIIKGNFNLDALEISDGTNARTVKGVWLKDRVDGLRAMITECTADPTLVGQVATLSLKYLVNVTLKGNGSVKINDKADWQTASFTPGETLEIELIADDYYACESVIVGRTEHAVQDGKVSFAFTGEEIYIDIAPIPYTVTLHANDGEVAKTEYDYDVEKSLTLPVPVKEGYIFDGWFADEAFSGDPVTGISVGSNGNKVFYAKWTASYSVSYVLEGGVNATENPFSVRADATVTLKDATKTGYRFIGWYTEETFENKKETLVNVAGNVILYAKFEVIVCTVTFNTNGGVAIASASVAYGESLTLPEEPVKDGYLFEAWYLDEACTKEFAAYGAIESDITLYAKWTKKQIAENDSGCKSSFTFGACSLAVVCGLAIFLTKKKEN